MKRKNFFIVVSLVLYFASSVSCSVKQNYYTSGLIYTDHSIDNKTINIGFIRGGIRTIQASTQFDKKYHLENMTIILGQTGIYLYDNDLTKIDSIDFINDKGKPIWFGLTPKHVKLNSMHNGIMMGGGGFGDVGLLDSDGKLLWNFKPGFMFNPNKMIAAELDGDGIMEFYTVGSRGLYRLDTMGKVIWRFDGDMDDVSVYSKSEYDTKSIIVLNSNGTFSLISSSGTLIKNLKINGDGISFARVDINGKSLIVHRSSFETINVANQEGKILFDYTYKELPAYHGPYATSVSFDGITTHIAVLMGSRSAVHKSVISIFSLKGKLVYQYILNGGTGLAAQFINKTKRQKLLVADGLNLSVIERTK